MASKSVLIYCAVVRFLILAALAASIVVLVTNKFTFDDGSKISFKDLIAYRFVLATACAGGFYTLIQIPFSVYYAYKGKRLIQNDFLPNFDFFGDKIFAFLLASGVGAGFAVTFELKRLLKKNFPGVEEAEPKLFKFLDRAYVASALLLLGFLFMALHSINSSINRTSKSKGFFFG